MRGSGRGCSMWIPRRVEAGGMGLSHGRQGRARQRMASGEFEWRRAPIWVQIESAMSNVDPKAGGGWRHGPQPRMVGQGLTEDGQ
jgi:hypothetical protein